MLKTFKRPSVIPGFKLSLGFTLFYLCLVVLIPLAMLFIKSSTLTSGEFWATVTSPRVMASYKLSFATSLIAATVNVFFGGLVAWVFIRYEFPGKKILNTLIDLPFALPTAVAGITLTALYAENGIIGSWLANIGIKVAFTPLGIIIALIFISFPFVVRTVEPVLADLDRDTEEAATCLGATRWQTFRAVIFPAIFPALLTGFTLSFARALGEYGSVVFISGNMPFKTEITPLLIITKLEQYDYAGATAIALVNLVMSFIILLIVNGLQWWNTRHEQK